MELSGFAALPYCLLLLAVYTTQAFRCWPAHMPIGERDAGTFRYCCFGCGSRYLLFASLYFLANAAFYFLLFVAAWLGGAADNASAPWLLLLLAIVLPGLPGLDRPRNALRYRLQRLVFRPALPSPEEAHLWRRLCHSPCVIRTDESETHTIGDRWEKLLLLSERLQRVVEHNPDHRNHAELAELTAFIHEKTSALQRRDKQDAQLLELLLGCCYLAIARLVTHERRDAAGRQARLRELGLQLSG